MMFARINLILLISLLLLTPGYAFFSDAGPSTGNKEIIVLLHGLGRNKTSMWLLASRLEDAGYAVHRIGYDSLHQNPQQILNDISGQINRCCQRHTESVHFVGHSLGGLLVRAYLDHNRVDHLGRVVLLGTPNQGTKAADHFSNSWIMDILGPTAKSLGTDENSFPNSLPSPYYPLGIIAGVIESQINDAILPGEDDGIVSVEATKVDGMTDFILIDTGHSRMRYSREVADQTIAFIKNGSFNEK